MSGVPNSSFKEPRFHSGEPESHVTDPAVRSFIGQPSTPSGRVRF